jgi:uncharacterized protein (TIGR00369 family)
VEELAVLAGQIFRAQPFTALVGAELTGVGQDWAEITVFSRKDLQQQHGFIHGGVISYLADNSLTFAGGMALGGDALTSEFKINYLKPAKGEKVVAHSQAVSVGYRQAVCQCSVHAVAGRDSVLVAIAQGTIVALSPGSGR